MVKAINTFNCLSTKNQLLLEDFFLNNSGVLWNLSPNTQLTFLKVWCRSIFLIFIFILKIKRLKSYTKKMIALKIENEVGEKKERKRNGLGWI